MARLTFIAASFSTYRLDLMSERLQDEAFAPSLGVKLYQSAVPRELGRGQALGWARLTARNEGRGRGEKIPSGMPHASPEAGDLKQ